MSTSSAPSATNDAGLLRLGHPRHRAEREADHGADHDAGSSQPLGGGGNQRVLTHTEGELVVDGLRHSVSIADRVASALSRVWSIRPARVSEVRRALAGSTPSGIGPSAAVTASLARLKIFG